MLFLNKNWFLGYVFISVFIVLPCASPEITHSEFYPSSFLPPALSLSAIFCQRLTEKIFYHLTSLGALPSRLDQVIILTFLSRCLIVLFSSSVSPTSVTFLTRTHSYLFSSYRHIHSPCYHYYPKNSISDIPGLSSILSNLVLKTSIRESI